MITPIYIPTSSEVNMDNTAVLGMYIALNIVMVLIFIIRVAYWYAMMIEKESFFEYNIWSVSDRYIFPSILALLFGIVNGLAIFIILTEYIITLIS